jgi:hypothetical protein
MRSKHFEAQSRREEEEEVLEFVRSLGISENEFLKTKDSAYHPPAFQTAEELEERKWQNPKYYKMVQEMESLKLQAERYEVCDRNIQLGLNAYFSPGQVEDMQREKERLFPLYNRYQILKNQLRHFGK